MEKELEEETMYLACRKCHVNDQRQWFDKGR